MYFRDTWAEVDCDAIEYNVQWFKQHTSHQLIAVLKANAYGHGDFPVALTAMQAGACMVAVSSLDEALNLRKQGFNDQILILGFVRPCDLAYAKKYQITCTIVSKEWANEACQYDDLEGLKLHLKVDSGMNRIGIKSVSEAQEILSLFSRKKINVEGIFTHYACADEDLEYCEYQRHIFHEILEGCSHSFKYIHCENTAALIQFNDERCNTSRLGLGMFGISPLANELPLKPAFSLFSKLTCVKQIKKGEKVGYGATYTAHDDCFIGTLSIGYADGFTRNNQGRKLICENESVELVGRICMDQCMVLLPYEMKVGSVVEIISKNLPVTQMANELNTIPYEILCLFSDRIPRIVYKNNQQIAIINNRLHD